LRGAPAAFAGDQLVAVLADGAHHHRLDQTLRPNGGGQFVQRFIVPVAARLVLAGLDVLDRQRAQFAFLLDHRGCAGVAAAKQGVEPASQSTFLRGRHAVRA